MAEPAMREAYGRALAEYGADDPNLIVLDADTSSSTLTCYFAAKYPERFVNLGIAEPCMVDVAVGLALAGKTPFANAFACVLVLRAMEQIRTCVCYAETNVKLISGYAGVSDFKDGPTHHALTDIAMMRSLPNMTVIVPGDAREVAKWVPIIAKHKGPLYFRLSRGSALPVHADNPTLEIGKGITLRQGSDVTLVACGTMCGRAMLAAEELAKEGISARVIEMHSLKPFDAELMRRAARETGAIVTAEEHTTIGGLGGAVAEALGQGSPTPLEMIGIADTFARTALDPETLMDAYGLRVSDVAAAAKRAIARKA